MASSSFDSNNMFEFPCNQCGRLLKVNSDAIGRQARCPDCHSIQVVPQPGGSPSNNPQANPSHSQVPDPNVVTPSIPDAHSQPHQQPQPAPNPNQTMVSPSMPQMPSGPSDPTPITQQTLANPSAFGMGTPTNPTGGPAPNTMPDPSQPVTNVAVNAQGGLSLEQSSYETNETPTRKLFERITEQIRKIYVGQDELVLGTLVAIFSNGHVLIESVPGLGKTLFIRTLGKVLGCKFGRIQFTADLMPSDITGAPIFNMKSQEFMFRPGPVFTQFLLADEINRSPAKTHAALLEIMQEYRVTVDGTSHELERPFLVMATQNPIESEGTYNLPEAQLDRFMLKLVVDYPNAEEESRILAEHSMQKDIEDRLESEVESVTSPEEIMSIVEENSKIRVDEKLLNYINKIVRLTREWPQFHMGASPRAGIALMQAARTLAAFNGRDYAVPDDVVRVVLPALRHRVILTAEAEVEGQDVNHLLTELIRTVEVPRL